MTSSMTDNEREAMDTNDHTVSSNGDSLLEKSEPEVSDNKRDSKRVAFVCDENHVSDDDKDSKVNNDRNASVTTSLVSPKGRESAKADDDDDSDSEYTPEMKRRRLQIIKNIAVLSVGFVLIFSSVAGLIILQSSLNNEGGLGVFGLCSNFGTVVVCCLLFAPLIIAKLGCKWALVCSFAGTLFWMAANMYATWGTIISGSIILGFSWAPMWTAQCTYFTISSIEYSDLTDELPDDVMARFFGIFFMMFMLGNYRSNHSLI